MDESCTPSQDAMYEFVILSFFKCRILTGKRKEKQQLHKNCSIQLCNNIVRALMGSRMSKETTLNYLLNYGFLRLFKQSQIMLL